ncbi:hypothetical protein PoB_001239600 [Plakobranchus ocellatus]|uniref:Uncharacterized protein n=1 Tax=Plakobranchus ocellatus TaxID=259542 RepID=A0AAV3YRF0_9GAST|nr:hypothetical protein PoB_001239600 [Plakobranchus ocellatus]
MVRRRSAMRRKKRRRGRRRRRRAVKEKEEEKKRIAEKGEWIGWEAEEEEQWNLEMRKNKQIEMKYGKCSF